MKFKLQQFLAHKLKQNDHNDHSSSDFFIPLIGDFYNFFRFYKVKKFFTYFNWLVLSVEAISCLLSREYWTG